MGKNLMVAIAQDYDNIVLNGINSESDEELDEPIEADTADDGTGGLDCMD